MESWKVRVRGRATVGPFPTALVVLGIERGKVPFESEVCREGTTIWRPLATVPAFFRAMGLQRPAPPPQPGASGPDEDEDVTRIAPGASGPDEDDDVTRIAPGAGELADLDDDDDDETRVLEALLPQPKAARRAPAPATQPARAPQPAAGRMPGRTFAPGAAPGAPPPPARPAARASDRAEDDARTEVFEHALALDAGRARLQATPPPAVRPGPAPDEPRGPLPLPRRPPTPSPLQSPSVPLPIEPSPGPLTAASLMDADDDENDVRRVHVGLSEPPGSIRPAAGAPPERASGRPPPRRSARPPVVNERPRRNYAPERADELTAPARRLLRDRARMTIALVVLAVGLVVTLALLLVLLMRG